MELVFEVLFGRRRTRFSIIGDWYLKLFTIYMILCDFICEFWVFFRLVRRQKSKSCRLVLANGRCTWPLLQMENWLCGLKDRLLLIKIVVHRIAMVLIILLHGEMSLQSPASLELCTAVYTSGILSIFNLYCTKIFNSAKFLCCTILRYTFKISFIFIKTFSWTYFNSNILQFLFYLFLLRST